MSQPFWEDRQSFQMGNEYRATGTSVPEKRAKGHEGSNVRLVMSVWIVFSYSDPGNDFKETGT